jgi:hypothetical protein
MQSFQVHITPPTPVATQALYDYVSSTSNMLQTLTLCLVPIDDFAGKNGCISFEITGNYVEIFCSDESWLMEVTKNQFSILKKCGSFINDLTIQNRPRLGRL